MIFVNQVMDDSTMTPHERFELTAVQAYEKTSRRAIIKRFADRDAQTMSGP